MVGASPVPVPVPVATESPMQAETEADKLPVELRDVLAVPLF